MLKKIAGIIAALIITLVVVIALQSDHFVVERSATIAAPAEVVYPHIADLRAMAQWSPFSQMDPQQTTTYDGPPAGVGAATAWDGPQAGKGRMTITAVEPNRRVDLRLEFERPMEATNRVQFLLVPAADGTAVTWRMEGENTFFGKAAGLVMDVDALVGGEFAKGLAALKALAESEHRPRPADAG